MTHTPETADIAGLVEIVAHRFRPAGYPRWSEWRMGAANLTPAFGSEWEEVTFVPATALQSLSAELAEARKGHEASAENFLSIIALKDAKLAAMQEALHGDAEIQPLSEDGLDRILDFVEHYRAASSGGDTASLSWSDQLLLINEAVLACRARALNGGGNAGEADE